MRSYEAGAEQRPWLAVFLEHGGCVGVRSEPWHHVEGASHTDHQPFALPASRLGAPKGRQNNQVSVLSGDFHHPVWEAAAHLDETEGEISKGGQCQPLPRGHRGFAIGRLVRPLGFILLIFIGGHPEEGAVGALERWVLLSSWQTKGPKK